ncbi:hypothetical protein AMTR_s00001p00238550 [Amborella trichopoda]|uniref:Uncharacterized protein n=1 Tax=Amborella trichopoda TaxID=13333 RepID=W1NMB6_AMBTC|nr:hypothetical protein AMTR_s00001p00238550 [Amborella trichopoda]
MGGLAASAHTRGGHKSTSTHSYHHTDGLATGAYTQGGPNANHPSHYHIGGVAASAHTLGGPKATHPSLAPHRRPSRPIYSSHTLSPHQGWPEGHPTHTTKWSAPQLSDLLMHSGST